MRRAVLAALTAVCTAACALVGPAFVANAAPGGTAPADTGRDPLMIVLDASGSMKLTDDDNRTKIDVARAAVRQVMSNLPDDARLGITTYGTKTGPNSSEKERGCHDVSVLRPVGPLDRAAAEDTIGDIEPSGYSPIGPALTTAAHSLPANGNRTVLLVSDGYDVCTTPDPCDTAKELVAESPGLTIHVLGIDVVGTDADALRCIAEAGGGRYLAGDLTDSAVLDQLKPLLANGYQRAIGSYEAHGVPIEGSPESSDGAPALTPGGYRDNSYSRGSYSDGGQTKRGSVRYYRVPFAAGMTPWASVTIAGDVRSEEYHSLGLRLTLVNGDDDPCLPAVEETMSPSDSGPMPVVTAQTGGMPTDADDWADACADTPVYLRAERLGQYRFGTALPVEIVIRAEPAASNADQLEPDTSEVTPDPPAASGSAVATTGADDFGTAQRLVPGSTVADTVVAGETRYFAVPLDWGQRLSYRLTPTGVGTPVDVPSESVTVGLRNPLRVPLPIESEGSTSFRYRIDSDGVPESLHGGTATSVAYGNRRSDDEKVAGFAVAGTYYLTVTLSPSDDAANLTVPYTLTVQTVGDADSAASATPRYRAGTASGETRTVQTTTSSGEAATHAAESDGSAGSAVPGWVWGMGGAALALLLAAVVAVLRRRSTVGSTPPIG